MPNLLSIPSPEINFIELGPLKIYFYGLFILLGMIVALVLTNYRLTKRGAEPWVVIDIGVIWAIPFGIIGARIYHVLSHPNDYFFEGADPWEILRIWNGGIAIFGALIGGAVGAFIGTRFAKIRFFTFADALAPGLLLAQAIGRFGNYFNQELYGQPTDLPWGLEIPYNNPHFPAGLPEGTLFHPTFLYESLWNVLGVVLILLLEKKFKLQWGKVFALYLIWYGIGRSVFEAIRLDPSEVFLGIRTNIWGAFAAILIGLIIIYVQSRNHTGLEPSPYYSKKAVSVAAEGDSDDFKANAEESTLSSDSVENSESEADLAVAVKKSSKKSAVKSADKKTDSEPAE